MNLRKAGETPALPGTTSTARLGRVGCVAALAAALAFLAGCGGSSSTSTTPPPSGSTVNNTQALQVNLGPDNNYPNGLFTDVTICVPGTSSCQDIPNVLVDTGSFGLRLLESQVTITPPQTTDSSGNVLQECIMFADGSYVWGPVATADIQMAGEKASAVPIQLISASNMPAAPSSCSSGGKCFQYSRRTLQLQQRWLQQQHCRDARRQRHSGYRPLPNGLRRCLRGYLQRSRPVLCLSYVRLRCGFRPRFQSTSESGLAVSTGQ